MRFYKKYFKGDDLRTFVSGLSRKLTKEGMPEDEARRLITRWNQLYNCTDYRLDESSVVEAASSQSEMPLCPLCASDKCVELSIYDHNGTHYCTACRQWFPNLTPTIQPEKPPSQAERENLPNMKLTVKRTDLIASLSASRDKIQNDHNAAVQAFNDAQASIRTLVDANKAGVGANNGITSVDGVSETLLKNATNNIAATLGLPSVAPVLPTSIAQLNTWIGKLNLASDETLELEDTSPYLQYIS